MTGPAAGRNGTRAMPAPTAGRTSAGRPDAEILSRAGAVPMPTAMPKFKPLAFPQASPSDRVATVILPPQHVWVSDEQADSSSDDQEPVKGQDQAGTSQNPSGLPAKEQKTATGASKAQS